MPRVRSRVSSATSAAPTNSRRTAGFGLIAAAAFAVSLLVGSVAQASTPDDRRLPGLRVRRRARLPPDVGPRSSRRSGTTTAHGGPACSSPPGKGSGGSHFNIFKFTPATNSWADTGRQIDIRDLSHGDYLWDGAANKLYVASSKSICTAAIAPPSQRLQRRHPRLPLFLQQRVADAPGQVHARRRFPEDLEGRPVQRRQLHGRRLQRRHDRQGLDGPPLAHVHPRRSDDRRAADHRLPFERLPGRQRGRRDLDDAGPVQPGGGRPARRGQHRGGRVRSARASACTGPTSTRAAARPPSSPSMPTAIRSGPGRRPRP